MLLPVHLLATLLVFPESSGSLSILNRNVQYYSCFSLESPRFSARGSPLLPPISQRTHTFINDRVLSSHGNLAPRKAGLFGAPRDLEREVEALYTGLKDKRWSFSDLQKRLTDEGVPLDGCNKPDDVIRRVAQLSLLGKEELVRQIQDSDPEFQSEYHNALESLKSEYTGLSKKERKSYLQSLLDKVEKYGSSAPDDCTDDQILELAARVQSKTKLEFRLPERSSNAGAQTVEAYKAEADSIFAVYDKVKHDEYLKKNFIDDIKNELILSNSDFDDCVTDEDLINRLSYSRVFPKAVPELPRQKRRSARARRSQEGNPLQAFFSLQGSDFGDLGKLLSGDPSKMFEDSFFGNFGLDSDMFEGLNFNGLSIFKDLAPMFGLNPNKFSKLQFQSSEADEGLQHSKVKFSRGDEDEALSEDDSEGHIETDPSLILLQQKAKVSGDPKLQTILDKAIRDPALRDVLRAAATKGYEHARELCSGNVKALYILEKLNDKHIWS